MVLINASNSLIQGLPSFAWTGLIKQGHNTNIFAVQAEIRTWRQFKPEALPLAPYLLISTI